MVGRGNFRGSAAWWQVFKAHGRLARTFVLPLTSSIFSAIARISDFPIPSPIVVSIAQIFHFLRWLLATLSFFFFFAGSAKITVFLIPARLRFGYAQNEKNTRRWQQMIIIHSDL